MMIGQSRQLRAVMEQLRRFAACDAPILLEGETGTGKELAAREIHYASRRAAKPFVPINCGALPDSLIESELFGHRRGAFTDAKTTQAGLIEHAQSGTLFLDEVDSLSPKAQVTLLRFLQDNQYRPVGGGEVRAADVRIVAATNASLVDLVAQGRFRGDLLYRLNALHICLPPLREREGDVALLADHFLADVTQRFALPPRRWTAEAVRLLAAYTWPGNVRELDNVVLRSCLNAEGSEIGAAAIAAADRAIVDGSTRASAQVSEPAATPPYAVAAAGIASVADVIAFDAGTRIRQRFWGDQASDRRKRDGSADSARARASVDVAPSFSDARTDAIATFECDYLVTLMRRAGGNVSKAARLSHIERRQLGKLLKKRGIEKKLFRDAE